ncbi:MAG: hypothetical protein PHR30_16520 [Gallionellaceae bacterium]|nr:hypothetical protein [Gallionellaceae bacterium]
MANLAAMRAALYSSDLRERFEAAEIMTAAGIYTEASTIANHAQRAQWAGKVMTNDRFSRASADTLTRVALGVNAGFQANGTGVDDAAVEGFCVTALASPLILSALLASA